MVSPVSGVVGLWRLWCLMVWTWVVGAMVSLVSGSPGACIVDGWSGLWCLMLLMLAPLVLGRAIAPMVSDVRGYGVYGACSFGTGWSGLWWGGAVVSMVSASLDLGGRGYGVYGV